MARRQDTFDLRSQLQYTTEDDTSHLGQNVVSYSDDELSADAELELDGEQEQHSMIEDDSDTEERYSDEDDRSSSLSIPNESIDFDLVYSLHSFAATVEGQASVVKGDSLVLMDDTNSYWWLVRVLKTQEIGYIPAENIETPFERLARLNKHRNVDLASATQAEMQSGLQDTRDRFLSARIAGSSPSPSPSSPNTNTTSRAHKSRSVIFDRSAYFSRYPPAIWRDLEEGEEDYETDGEDEFDVGTYAQERLVHPGDANPDSFGEEFDGIQGIGGEGQGEMDMSWEDAGAGQEEQRRVLEAQAQIVEAERMQQLQRQQIEEQRRVQQQQLAQQQQQATAIAQQQATAQAQAAAGQQVRRSDSREQISAGDSPTTRTLDPATASETRKISVTPSIAQEAGSGGPLLPSAIMARQEDDRKRTREEIEALEEAARKKARASTVQSQSVSPAPLSPQPGQQQQRGPAKLTKERPSASSDDEGGKRAKSGLLSKFFGGRKDKHKDKGSNNSISESNEGSGTLGRPSDDSGSGRSGSVQSHTPTPTPSTTTAVPGSAQSPASQHAQQLRNRDQEQMALYQQYLNRSPASPPEVQPSYGMMSAPLMSTSSASSSSMNMLSPASAEIGGVGGGRKPRPGSLLIGPGGGLDGPAVPELSVIRVFAGKKVQTEATFKTVLLNSNTSAAELVRQAMQRFRLPQGEDPSDYYLTVKQIEGSSAVLRPEEHPLVVFEGLVEQALEMPKVKRSSVGSISSIASNLSMHPAIKKLAMNDFTDDSAVKFYLNRRRDPGEESLVSDEGDLTITAESVLDESMSGGGGMGGGMGQSLTVPGGGGGMAQERFMSPSVRFAMKVLIYPVDLPDDMIFDPITEAIVFKNTLRSPQPSSQPPQSQQAPFRRKIFLFPKNITVAEVIEIGLERFGISEGVVDGGDEVEDKSTKRRSSSRVRYVLKVSVDGKERELGMSSKIIDAYPRPPTYKSNDRTPNKRRSVDSMQILGTPDDVSPDDPIFVLRRATTYRPSTARHPAPLDDVALHHLHKNRDSASSTSSGGGGGGGGGGGSSGVGLSRAELIAAQREAQRASQRAMLGPQANASRGTDVRLPGGALLRSTRATQDSRVKYVYVPPGNGGGPVDVSEIVEEEYAPGGVSAGGRDLLAGAGQDGRMERVLGRIRTQGSGQATIDSIASLYSGSDDGEDGEERSETPTLNSAFNPKGHSRTDSQQRVLSPVSMGTGSRNATPVQQPPHLRSMSSASVMSGESGYRTAIGSPVPSSVAHSSSSHSHSRANTTTPTQMSHGHGHQGFGALGNGYGSGKPKVYVPRDDFGVGRMMSIIELAGLAGKAQDAEEKEREKRARDPLEDVLFGRDVRGVVGGLHPAVRDIYEGGVKGLEEMDRVLDEVLMSMSGQSQTA
ncbi:hypothetical protein PENSPDRAFT_750027 [Peniophora sp. CONT]|nr:hypothetical protein PENSPDRAFT_750027 [Peniophora sp. CONT]